jgi:putative ABC transport system permease protein
MRPRRAPEPIAGARVSPAMESLSQDLRYAFRALRKSPGFAAVTIAVLALGIGANTAIFSVVHAVLLKPLPFPEADRIVAVPHTPPQDIFPGRKYFSVSPANYYDWKAQNDVFSHMAIVAGGISSVTGSGDPVSLPSFYVSSEFFAVMGARPLRGRLLGEGDDAPGHDVAVISEELWKSRFGSDPVIEGKTAIIDGKSHTIVGVLPAKLSYPADTSLWLPLVFSPEDRAIRAIHDFGVLARLKKGVSVGTARTQMNAIADRLAAQYPADNKGWGAAVLPLHEDLVGDVRPALLVLLGAVGFVLLIACANVANLVLARTVARRKEIAVRAALGAGRGRIVRPILAETLVMAVVGGALGLLLAGVGVRLIVAFLGEQMPRVNDIRVDLPVLAFTFTLAILTGILAGLLPAWKLSRANPNDALKEGGRSDSDAGSPVLRHTLVVAEVALALVLMLGAGLLVRSLSRLQNVPPGFEPKNVFHARISLPDSQYATPEAKAAFFERVLERVRALPGVETAGTMNTLPLTDGGSTQPVAIEGGPVLPLSGQPEVAVRILSPGTLGALRIRLLEGRDVASTDTLDKPGAVLITESMAKRFWPGQSAVGKRLKLSFSPETQREVVGVVADVKLRGLAKTEPVPALFAPHAQMPWGWMALLVRTAQDPASISSAVRAAIHAIDPNLPIVEVGTMEEHLGKTLSHPRFNMLLLAVFAVLALVLSALGIYSVLSYAVRRRTREIGIRMALGANRRDVLRLIVLQGMRPALIGLAIGLAGALALGRALSSLVFGVRATDPLTFAAVSLLLGLVALAACAVPAWRASRVHPTEALHEG